MGVRDILLYPERESELRMPSQPVGKLDRSVRRLIVDLKDTLRAHADGIGLAAPQMNDHRRVVLVRLGARNEAGRSAAPPLALIDPVILEARDERMDFDGCLSFPGLFGETKRPHHLRVTGLEETGRPFDRIFEGFDAVVAHHEIDHLDGVLFIDRIARLDDLYRVQFDEEGRGTRLPLSTGLAGSSQPPLGIRPLGQEHGI